MDNNKSNMDNYSNLKMFKIYSYESNILTSKLEKLPIYLDKTKLILLDNFIGELYDDLHYIINDYEFRKFITYLLEPKNKPETLYLTKLFDYGLFQYDQYMQKLIEINDDEIFFNIINKYSSVYIGNKNIFLDPLVNLTLSNNEFNISKLIFNSMINNLNKQLSKKTYIISYDRLEKIVSYLPNSNNYFTKILYEFNYIRYINRINLSKYITNNITNKTKIDIKKIESEKKESFLELYIYVLFKILFEHNKFEDFGEILNIMYCSSCLELLDMIVTIKPELINLDLIGLKKIIYYGRFNVFEFLFFNIPYVIMDLLSKSNPLDITELVDISYTEDIWNGTVWYESENEKRIIGTRKHKELIDLIMSICAEKNYSHVLWTEDIKKYWINLALEYKLELNYQDSSYFISYDNLLELLELVFDSKNKDSIKSYYNMFGKKATWNWIKESCDENFLDLFFI